jgi:hypothetical protein
MPDQAASTRRVCFYAGSLMRSYFRESGLCGTTKHSASPERLFELSMRNQMHGHLGRAQPKFVPAKSWRQIRTAQSGQMAPLTGTLGISDAIKKGVPICPSSVSLLTAESASRRWPTDWTTM